MIDAHERRSERSSTGRNPQPHTLPASSCKKALIELCARIWWELERLANWRDCGDPALELLSETLRLELVLIMDSCESPSWMLMLDMDVRRHLIAMSKAVLSILAVSPNALTRRVFECAQDRVFDEALSHYESGSSSSFRLL